MPRGNPPARQLTQADYRRLVDVATVGHRNTTAAAVVVLEGSVTGSATDIPLKIGGGAALGANALGVPVTNPVVAEAVGVAWVSDDVPSGDWTLTLRRKPVGGGFADVATFTIPH